MQAVMAFVVDLLFGDPSFVTHPVILMGKLISWGEGFLWHDDQDAQGQKLAGTLLVLGVVGIAFGVGYALLLMAAHIHGVLAHLLSIWLISTTIAAKGLWTEAGQIQHWLQQDNLAEARKAVGRIVGRDTAQLDTAGVIRATVESVAENTVDAVIAPLFYALLAGAPLALAYRAVNTLDSMVGYKNERYRDFGWAAARVDDIVNYIPARLTGLLMTVSAAFLSLDAKNCWLILCRDSSKHPSPNSGLPEAAVAGALQIQLGGESSYQGTVSFRPYLGNPGNALIPNHINQTRWLMVMSGILAILAGSIIWVV
ncbi:MAG: cobalamin biosynthesis protein CobD [Firmicutes bacterium]|nr:cobalamin biosynthesis protein CobD [Bacillota bacterium]